MIWESGPWKHEIERCVDRLQRRKSQKRWTETSMARLERDIFYVAYAVRKLIDSAKLSDEVESIEVEATAYPLLGEYVDVMNWHKLNELYDLSEGRPRAIPLREFCNQIIHSFVFLPLFAEQQSGLLGLFVASDYQKDQEVLCFGIDAIIEALSAVALDDIVEVEMKREGVGKPLKIVKKSCKTEAET